MLNWILNCDKVKYKVNRNKMYETELKTIKKQMFLKENKKPEL